MTTAVVAKKNPRSASSTREKRTIHDKSGFHWVAFSDLALMETRRTGEMFLGVQGDLEIRLCGLNLSRNRRRASFLALQGTAPDLHRLPASGAYWSLLAFPRDVVGGD
jgi:hypothetical protein